MILRNWHKYDATNSIIDYLGCENNYFATKLTDISNAATKTMVHNRGFHITHIASHIALLNDTSRLLITSVYYPTDASYN